MQNRITDLFKKKKSNVLSIYFTAGFPSKNSTAVIIEELEKVGVDMIEIGIPYSDPLADGPTIQHSSEVALKNGMTLKLLFEQLKEIRKKVSIPLLLMGYVNPVMQYGIKKFCVKAKSAGIDGIILPDLPMQEYLDEYKNIFEENGLSNIFLVTPQSSEERIRMIDEHTNGFIYLVSSASTTGKNLDISGAHAYFRRIKEMDLENSVMTGFGIHDRKSFLSAVKYSNGAIIGSAFIKAIDKSKNLKKDIQKFISKIR
jgi:tryptophan synthase alpha chain